ncbi:Saccharopine dehydrogenase-domain-containing protein [Phaeosphaeria sp. MPI-PUGE-AT-0046c]|nr:Saccharopine dehydrogenase-domain-containing protein [Phaeosphaeria sp. MPI-PUGE-AT-0046c]
MAQREYELILLGATGYTGNLVAEWISTRLPEDLKWAVAGRNTNKLQKVVDGLKQLNPDRKQPDIQTCELETDQLEALAKKTKLVVTTVGPCIMHYGEPVLAACANNGTHYLDCTGEIPWVYDMIAKYDALAKKNNSIIIPEIGLDSVPADILAYVLAREVRRRYNTACERVMATLYAAKTGVSGGTSLTMVELFCNYSLTHLAKSMHPYSLSPVKAKESMSSPTGGFPHRLFGLLSVPELGGTQTVGLMAGVDECITHRSWGLYAQAADSSNNASLSYGPRFRFNEYMRTSSIVTGALIKLALGTVGLLLALPPTRWILAPLIKTFVIQAPGQGPSKESMKNDFFSYRGVGIAEDGKGKVTAKLDVAHGGYATTGLTMSAAAQVILRGRLEETEAGRLGGGILTPATLGEQYVETLNDFGMKIKIDN